MASIFKTDAGTYRVKVSIPINGKYKQKQNQVLKIKPKQEHGLLKLKLKS